MTHDTTYRSALAVAAFTTAFLVLGAGALGVIGAEGDSADLMFLGVIAIGVAGATIARLRPDGMAWTMTAMAIATMTVGFVAIGLGRHEADESSVIEILGLTGMYASLFAAAAWLFRTSARVE